MSGRLSGIGVAVVLLVGACSGPQTSISVARGQLGDPVWALPGAPRLLEVATPYGFRTSGAARLPELNLRLGGNPEPTAKVILARAYLDALLFAQTAKDDAMFAEVTGKLRDLRGTIDEPWREVASMFADAAREGGQAGEVAGAGQRLLSLMINRQMDSAYHREMATLAGGPLAVEVRVARMLDLSDALREVASEAGPEQRLDALLSALGPSVCPELPNITDRDQRWARCDLGCPSMRDSGRAGPPDETLVLVTCSPEQTGWPARLSDDLYSPSVALLTRIFSLGIDDARVVTSSADHPLGIEIAAEIEAMVDTWAREPIVVEVPLDGPEDFGPELSLPVSPSTSAPSQALVEGPLVVMDAVAIRLALAPALIPSEHGGADLWGADEGFGFPGNAVVFHGDAVDAVSREVVEAHFRRRLREARGFVRLHSREGETVLFLHRDLPLSTVLDGLRLVAGGIGAGGRLTAYVAVWDPSGRLGYRRWGLFQGGENAALEAVAAEARPLDLRLVLADRDVTVIAHGERAAVFADVDGKLDAKGLAATLAELRLANPSESVATFVVEGSQRRVADLVRLTEIALDRPAGFDQHFIELDGQPTAEPSPK